MKRDTNSILMTATHELAVKNGCYAKAENIIDYYIPVRSTSAIQELTNYQFDFSTELEFGGSEGIYLSCYIKGVFDESKKHKSLHCGTYKTLNTDLESMKILGELAGSLIYYAREYVNRELDRYTPIKEIKKEVV